MRYAAPTSRNVELPDGQRLFVGDWPAQGPVLVLAHGLTNQHRDFCGVAAELDGQFRIVAPDLRGRGNSTTAPAGGYGIEQHARDVLAVMDGFGVDKAIVGGHSMGAYVATAVATIAPDRVVGLVLIDGGVVVPLPGLEKLDPEATLAAIVGPVMDRLGMTYAAVTDYFQHWRDSNHLDGAWGPAIESALTYDLEPTPAGYRPRCSPEAAREDWRDLLTSPRTQARLSEVSCPVLAIAAEYGMTRAGYPILGEIHQEMLADLVPGVELVRVADTTHHTITLSELGAEATATHIREFAAKGVSR